MARMLTDRERLILLNLIPEIGTIRVQRLLAAFGSLQELFAAPEDQLWQVEGIGQVLARRFATQCRNPQPVEEELHLAKQAGCAVVTQRDVDFPTPLKQIPDPPLVLYMKGQWVDEDQVAVAVVGSRRASLYGQQIAERLAYDLAIRGVTVISGLARGIDAAAHRGALKAHGRTLAVLGNGLASIYPPEHKELAEQVAERGAVLSEYPMRMEPLAQNFPRRNRLISGLSLGVVIVEAARRSGALITADCALEQGREVFAVPGKVDSVTSQGTHQLLKQGARLVTSVEDILEELRLVPLTAGGAEPAGGSTVVAAGLAEAETRVLACVEADPRTIDAIALESGLGMPEVSSLLLQLEVKHLVRQLPGKRFIKIAGGLRIEAGNASSSPEPRSPSR